LARALSCTIPTVNDAQLLEQMLDGDQAAFVQIVTRYQGTLLRVARIYVASDATAEDVAQETWIAVLKGAERFEGRSSFKTWLLRICANRARSMGLREHRSIPVDTAGEIATVPSSRFNEAGMWADPPVPFTELVEGRLDSEAVLASVRFAIAGLGEPASAVVTLRDVEGLSSREVADLLDLSEANVRVILHRGRARVRAALENTMRGARS
jgi:RNA polymerase sigma-70 factor (ECF subfamily)